MRSHRALVGLWIIVSSGLACGTGNDPRGGTDAPMVAVNDTVSGEIAVAESDTFFVRAPAKGQLVVYLQALDSNVIEVLAEGYGVINHPTTSASYVESPPLEANRTSHFPVLEDSVYRLILRPPAATLPPYRAGRYRFLPATVDPRPEHTPELSPIGIDYSDEDLASSADIDAWTLGTPIADTMGIGLKVTVEPPGGDLPLLVYLHTGTGFNSFEFTIPPGGGTVQSALQYSSVVYQWYAQVQADDPPPLQTRAPRLPPIRIQTIVADFRPEHRPALLTLGDSLGVETIDSVGDVDTWRMLRNSQSNPAYLGALAMTSGTSGDTLRLSISDDVGTAPPNLFVTLGDTVLLDHLTVPLRLSYNYVTARVAAQHLASPASRPTYRFVVVPLDSLPEKVSALFTLGQTLTAEALDFAGDVDEFTFQGTANQSVTLDLETGSSFGAPAVLELVGVDSLIRDPGIPLGTSPLTVTLPATARYWVRVKNLQFPGGRGAYRLTIY